MFANPVVWSISPYVVIIMLFIVEPGMIVVRVVRYEVNDDACLPLMQGVHKKLELLASAILGVDVSETARQVIHMTERYRARLQRIEFGQVIE